MKLSHLRMGKPIVVKMKINAKSNKKVDFNGNNLVSTFMEKVVIDYSTTPDYTLKSPVL